MGLTQLSPPRGWPRGLSVPREERGQFRLGDVYFLQGQSLGGGQEAPGRVLTP